MVQLPVWELGTIILVPMTIAFAVRGPLEHKLMETTPPIRQSTVQFRLELSLFLTAGVVMAFILLGRYHFPLLQSGMKLVLGIFTVGFFAALDLALSREMTVIKASLAGGDSFEPPSELSPLTRRFSLAATFILLLITAIIILVLIRDVHWLAEQDLSLASINTLGRSVLIEIIFVMGFLLLMVINLVFSYARNLRILFDNETMVLEGVSQGDLSRRVPVTTRDELGVIAGHTNAMIDSLREGVRMRRGLQIAQEIQQHFLPDRPPEISGLDLAGTARFSDETGGDFYDFISCEKPGCGLLAAVVGDVSGHGIGAALLMASGRALVRQNTATANSPAQDIVQVNRQLARDIDDTGRFITLFYIILDPATNMAIWVNAGHPPPLMYDATNDTFSELKGEDIPLGVVEDWQFNEHYMDLPGQNQVLVIATDGAWEERNRQGEMFGAQRLKQVIRDNAHQSARGIQEAICEAVRIFRGKADQEDDLTLVVIKGKDS